MNETENTTTKTPINVADYIRDDSEVTRAACPTYHRKLTDKFIMLTMLEDEAPHLDTGDGDADAKAPKKRISFGKMGRDDQMKIINDPSFPANERENVLEHWKVWDKYHRETVEQCPDGQVRQKSHGVLLVSGGKDAVDEKADEWLANHKPKKKRKRKKGDSGEQKLSAFGLATQLDPEHFEWTDDEKTVITNAIGELMRRANDADSSDNEENPIRPILEIMKSRLEGAGADIESFYGILHDKDVLDPIWDDETRRYLKEAPKEKHIHIVVKFAGGRDGGLTIANIASAIGMPSNMIEKPAPGRYAFDNMLSYLIHAKDSDKYGYDKREVVTLAGKDYVEIYNESIFRWARGAAEKKTKRVLIDLEWVCEEIMAGRIDKHQIVLDSDYASLYRTRKGRSAIDLALDTAQQAKILRELIAFNNREFTKTVVFVEGEPGAGKTLYVSTLIECLKRLYGWKCNDLAAKNALDGYDGGEIMLLDDARACTMGIEDWLRLLDNSHVSPGSARYRNKEVVVPRVIIITFSKTVLEFFYFVRGIGGGDRSESIDQFFRRISNCLHVFNPREYGFFNYLICKPKKKSQTYTKEIGVSDTGGGITGTEAIVDTIDLSVKFEPDPESLCSPYAALKWLMKDIDKKGGIHTSPEEFENRFIEAAQIMFENYAIPAEEYKADSETGLPPIPKYTDGYALESREAYEAHIQKKPIAYGITTPIPRALPPAKDNGDKHA